MQSMTLSENVHALDLPRPVKREISNGIVPVSMLLSNASSSAQ